MRILHFYLPQQSETDTDIVNSYLSVLTDQLAGQAEVMLINSIERNTLQAEEIQPELIHIHGCWHRSAAMIGKWAHSHNIPYVISPHGKLDPWVVDNNYLREKLPKMMLYHHEMICNADAIIVGGEMERKSLTQLSWNEHIQSSQPWNKRIEIIPNCIITNTISPEQMASLTLRLYQKVIDTNAWMLMNEHTRKAVDILLQVGIAHDINEAVISADERKLLTTLNDECWRKIIIYADDEDVTPFISRAAERLQLTMPAITANQICRFPPRLVKPKGALESESLLNRSLRSKFRNLSEDYGECIEISICRQIANIALETKKGIITRRHLVDIYEQFRYNPFNEEQLARMLKESSLFNFTQSLQQTLASMFRLTEGFMPLPPLMS